MNIAILTFDGFNELDSFIALGILNRMKGQGWNIQITSPTPEVTSMNGVVIQSQQQLEFVQNADVVLFGSGIYTREISVHRETMSQLVLNSTRQLVGAQCSGTLLLAKLGLLDSLPACTDLKSKPWVIEAGIEVVDQPFIAEKNIATAGGCLSSQYLACWVILKLAGVDAAKSALHYVAPVGEKDETVERCLHAVQRYI